MEEKPFLCMRATVRGTSSNRRAEHEYKPKIRGRDYEQRHRRQH